MVDVTRSTKWMTKEEAEAHQTLTEKNARIIERTNIFQKTEPLKKGTLELKHAHRHTSKQEFVCINCDTAYHTLGDTAFCNGHIIDLCPWCREDSKPWWRGRGC